MPSCTSIKRGYEYITVVNALYQARVLEVIDHRTEQSLNAFWEQYEANDLERVEVIAMGYVVALHPIGTSPHSAGRHEDRFRQVSYSQASG